MRARSIAMRMTAGVIAAIVVACGGEGDPAPTPTATRSPEPSMAEFVPDPMPGAPGTLIFLDAPASQPLTDGEFAVTVNVRDVTNLGAFRFALTTSGDGLEILDVREGDFLGSSGREVSCEPAAIDTNEAAFTCVTLREAPEGVTGSGILAHLTLRARDAGDYELQLVGARTQIVEPAGAQIDLTGAVGGTVTVE